MDRINTAHKMYVKVRADYLLGGEIIPVRFKLPDGKSYNVNKVLDVREAPSLKAGGQGTRYTCLLRGADGYGDKNIYLFHDQDNWFIEV